MATGSSMVAGSSDIGKGLFGYRRTDVKQLISDRDLMLRHAESRIRSAEARIGQLENSLAEADERNARLEEQLRRFDEQLQAMAARNVEVEELAGRVRRQSESMSAWRSRIHRIAGEMGSSVDRFAVLADGVPLRVEEALSPLADKMTFLLALMEDFAEVTRPRRNRVTQTPS
jgi:chromosome segregation ATPase